jgi:hypothetical protein
MGGYTDGEAITLIMILESGPSDCKPHLYLTPRASPQASVGAHPWRF